MNACKHERLKCTNNVFYCLACGAQVKAPEPAAPAEKPVKKGKQTTAKKEG
jgi:hypothetical protein